MVHIGSAFFRLCLCIFEYQQDEDKCAEVQAEEDYRVFENSLAISILKGLVLALGGKFSPDIFLTNLDTVVLSIVGHAVAMTLSFGTT